MSRKVKATLIWALTPYICVMLAATIWESAAIHRFDAHFLLNWKLHLCLLLAGFVIAWPGTALQWLIADRYALLAITLGFFFSLACVATMVGVLRLLFHDFGSFIGILLFSMVFAPPAGIGGIVSGIIRVRDRKRTSAVAAGSL